LIKSRQTEVFRDLPQQTWRNVPPSVYWNGRAPAIRMTKLFMGAALTNLDESELLQDRNHLF
jgi:hypothetical protein